MYKRQDLTLPVDVATGAGFAAATVADDSGTPSLRLSAASPGSWGGRVEVATGPGGRSVTASRDGVTSGVLVTPVVTTAGFRVGDACRLSQEIGGVAVEASAVVAAVDAVSSSEPPASRNTASCSRASCSSVSRPHIIVPRPTEDRAAPWATTLQWSRRFTGLKVFLDRQKAGDEVSVRVPNSGL